MRLLNVVFQDVSHDNVTYGDTGIGRTREEALSHGYARYMDAVRMVISAQQGPRQLVSAY